MILNSAFIENRKFDGVTINDTKEFIDKLLAAKDLVADVYINRKLVCSGMLKLMLNNNWVIGCVDERLSITNMADPATNLHILVHQLGYDTTDDIILSVESPLSTFIEPGDLDSDLYFSVISTVPNCTQRCFVPESMFRNLRTDNIPPKDFEECADDPTVVPDAPIIITYTKDPRPSATFIVYESDGETHYGGKGEISLTWNFKVNGTPIGGKFDSDTSMYDPQSEELWDAIDAGGEVTVTLVDNIEGVSFQNIVATLG